MMEPFFVYSKCMCSNLSVVLIFKLKTGSIVVPITLSTIALHILIIPILDRV